MKRLMVIAGTLLAGVSLAGRLYIVSSFPAPHDHSALGLDYYGGYLYNAGGQKKTIYQITTTGSLVRRITDLTKGQGIDRTAAEFWTTTTYPDHICRLSTTGSILYSFKAPGFGYGITFGAGFLWYTRTARDICKITTHGSILTSFEVPARLPLGIYCEPSYLWIVDRYNSTIYEITYTGSVVDSFPAPAGRELWGLTRQVETEEYVWYTAGRTDAWIYKARVSFTRVAPASLGRVKALYR